MTIKLIALDFDGVIPVDESPHFLFENLGKGAESEELSKEFYAGLAAAKTDAERDKVPAAVWIKSFALYRQFPIRKMKKVVEKLKWVKGSRELFAFCKENSIKTAVISATIRPIISWNLAAHNVKPDFLVASECTSICGRLDRLIGVVSPLGKERALKKIMQKNKLKKSEVLVVGDSFSEIPMFMLVGKANSIGFNYRQDLAPYCGHLLFKQGDPMRDLRKIIGVIEGFE